MYVQKCWQCFRVGSSLGVEMSFCLLSSRRSCQSIQLCLNTLYLVQNIRNTMDTDGLQKKILELSKNAAELQVSISTLGGTKRQPIVYSGLARGISTSVRQTALNLSVLKKLQCNRNLDSVTALTKKVAVWRLKTGLIQTIHSFILSAKLNFQETFSPLFEKIYQKVMLWLMLLKLLAWTDKRKQR